MRQANQFLVNAAEKMELPPDVIAGLPHIELIGNVRILIDGHKGLKEYTTESISVGSKLGDITVRGHDLHLQSMTKCVVTIGGSILSVVIGETSVD